MQRRIRRYIFNFLLGCSALSACSDKRDVVQAESVPSTDSALIQRYLTEQVAIGPRFSGSKNAEKTARWIAAQSPCPAVIDEFTDDTPAGEKVFRNVIVTIPGKSPKTILIGAHYDTKQLIAVPDFIGANDGASGVAALLAIIGAFKGTTPEYTLQFCFFDGEEALYEYTDTDGLHGSRHHAAKVSPDNCIAMILLDMVGDRDLNVLFPADTDAKLLKTATETAQKSGMDSIFHPGGPQMLDDHIPFAKRGIPAIDLIDFEYGPKNIYWHTRYDNMDHVSAESVKTAADYTIRLIYALSNGRKP